MNDQNTATTNKDKDADPDKEHARDDHRRDVEHQQQPEEREIGDEEMIDQRNEARPRELCHQRAVERLRDDERNEGRRKQPRQISDAAAIPI
jgi:hypothetical protein